MNTEHKIRRSMAFLFLLVLTSLAWAQNAGSRPADNAIAVKIVKNSVVMVTNPAGKVTAGENTVCVVIRDAVSGRGLDVSNVHLEFSLHVGRILQKPRKAQLSREAIGRYCGQMNLDRLYYTPSIFHVEIRYSDVAHKQRKTGFCIRAVEES